MIQTLAEHFQHTRKQGIHDARRVSACCHYKKNKAEPLSFSMMAL